MSERLEILSSIDTERFFLTGNYFGARFKIERVTQSTLQPGCMDGVFIDDRLFNLIYGAKVKMVEKVRLSPTELVPFALQETPRMRDARLAASNQEMTNAITAKKSTDTEA